MGKKGKAWSHIAAAFYLHFLLGPRPKEAGIGSWKLGTGNWELGVEPGPDQVQDLDQEPILPAHL